MELVIWGLKGGNSLSLGGDAVVKLLERLRGVVYLLKDLNLCI